MRANIALATRAAGALGGRTQTHHELATWVQVIGVIATALVVVVAPAIRRRRAARAEERAANAAPLAEATGKLGPEGESDAVSAPD